MLDVAGGRGSLSFALQSLHGVSCTIIDPRPPKPTKEQLRFLRQPRKLLHSDTAASGATVTIQRVGRSSASPAASVAGQAASRASGGFPATRTDATEDSAGSAQFSPSPADATEEEPRSCAAPDVAFANLAFAAELAAGPTEVSGRAKSWHGLSEHIQAAFDEELWSGHYAESLNKSSLVIGLHPDQVRCQPSAMQWAPCMQL